MSNKLDYAYQLVLDELTEISSQSDAIKKIAIQLNLTSSQIQQLRNKF